MENVDAIDQKASFLMPVDDGPTDHQSIAGKKREQVTRWSSLMWEVDEYTSAWARRALSLPKGPSPSRTTNVALG